MRFFVHEQSTPGAELLGAWFRWLESYRIQRRGEAASREERAAVVDVRMEHSASIR
jgi:hypothetical protein